MSLFDLDPIYIFGIAGFAAIALFTGTGMAVKWYDSYRQRHADKRRKATEELIAEIKAKTADDYVREFLERKNKGLKS